MKFFSKNDAYRGKLMREIDCAHSRSVKTLSWPWFRVVYWCENEKIRILTRYPRVFLCEKSITRVFETWKCFWEIVIFDQLKKHTASPILKTPFSSMNQDQRSIFTFQKHAQSISRIEKPSDIRSKSEFFIIFASIRYPESGSRKRFHASGECAQSIPRIKLLQGCLVTL
jgi:hypothetical protein